MRFKKTSFIVILFSTFVCTPDYSVITKEEIEILENEDDTRVHVEYFIQPEKPENLDVLVILDTSCSMSDNFENVSMGLDILRGDVDPLTEDYQMALINSSLDEPYMSDVLTKDSTSMEIYLAPYSLGQDRQEILIASMYQFATATKEGSYYLRPGVDKLYIFVSDEPEQSTIPISLFKDWMDTYHEDVQHDVVVIGVTDYSTCDSHYYLDPKSENRFLTLANYYNKNIIDICGDFETALAESSFLVQPITHMKLSEKPIEETIVVYQAGVEKSEWYYLTGLNTIYFEFEIEEGAIIEIGYESLIEH